MKVSVIIPAAGLGTRMASKPAGPGDAAERAGVSRKQFMLLDNEPVIVHTIRKFASSPSVAEIVIAVRPEDAQSAAEWITQAAVSTPIRIVEGGNSRQQSVDNALASLPEDTALVAVHDAVRPFIDVATIEQVFAEAASTGAAIVGIVPVDTVKQVKLNKIRQTIPREHLVLAQTPQVFRYSLLRQAFEKARHDNFTGTDEASLVERLEQVEVSVVSGSDRNIKITKPSDMELARLFLAQEKGR